MTNKNAISNNKKNPFYKRIIFPISTFAITDQMASTLFADIAKNKQQKWPFVSHSMPFAAPASSKTTGKLSLLTAMTNAFETK